MKTSEKGLNLIKKFEGCRLTAYKCPAGVLTIGYGHTGSDVVSGMKITQAQAVELLKKDLEKFEKKVEKYNGVYGWNQNQFDAMVSFAYNVGSIDQLTAKGTRSISEISEKILAYNKAAGKVLKGLVNRREAEKKLFDEPVNVVNKPVSETKTMSYKVTAKNGLYCRNKASMKGDPVGIFAFGTKVEFVCAADSPWYKVKGKATNGKTVTGYSSSKYLEKV